MSNSTSVYGPKTVNRIRLNMIFINIGNKIMQDQLIAEIENIKIK